MRRPSPEHAFVPSAAVAVAVACTVACMIGGAARAADLPVAPRFDALDQWMADHPAFFPGGAGLVLVEDGTVVFCRTYHGLSEDDVLPIASSTKWISGLAITAAIADPAVPLSLETPIAEHVPAFGPPSAPEKAGITLAHAFGHLSALPGGEPNPHRQAWRQHERAVALIAALELDGVPGGQVRYDGKAMSAAGLAVANALGTDWTTYVDDVLFTPLGMDDTDFDAFTPRALVPTANPNPAGSIRTSMADYERFLVMLGRGGTVDGVPIVRPEAIDLLLRDLAGSETPIDFSPFRTYEPFVPGAGDYRPGFGCFLDPAHIVPASPAGPGHGRWAVSAGAFGTVAFIDRDRRLTGVLFTENRDRWPNPDPALPPYNPATRAFLEFVRPLIEAAVPVACPSDVNDNGFTGFLDLALVLAAWQAPGGPADVDGDGAVDFADLVLVLSAWGPCR